MHCASCNMRAHSSLPLNNWLWICTHHQAQLFSSLHPRDRLCRSLTLASSPVVARNDHHGIVHSGPVEPLPISDRPSPLPRSYDPIYFKFILRAPALDPAHAILPAQCSSRLCPCCAPVRFLPEWAIEHCGTRAPVRQCTFFDIAQLCQPLPCHKASCYQP